MIGRNDTCWCGSQLKWKKCHYPQTPPQESAQELFNHYRKAYQITLKNAEEIKKIRRAGHLAAHILEATCKEAKAGVTTAHLNDFAHKLHVEAGAIPAPLNYGSPPFPKSICTSLNEVICHGIPNNTPLKEGDILNIDVTCILDGYFGDCSRMVCIEKVSEEKQSLVDIAYESLMQSISILKPGVMISEIGNTICDYAENFPCSVVHQFIGHGVGARFHEPPQVPHHRNHLQIPLAPGMVFTIEPMINAGVAEGVIDPKDQWTARTVDGKPSAQWEHTLLITETSYEILTPWKRENLV